MSLIEFYTRLYFEQIFTDSYICKIITQVLNGQKNVSSVCDKESIQGQKLYTIFWLMSGVFSSSSLFVMIY